MPHVTATLQAAIDLFPCGLVVTNCTDRTIVAANKHFYRMCQAPDGSQLSFASLLTKASKIMLESYVIPLLLKQQHCDEIQLTVENVNGVRLPILVNARIAPEHPELIYWVVTAAKQRDELYQELVNLRNHLEDKAEALSTLAKTDELTGLLNRRAFIEHGNQLINDSKQQQSAYAFLMIDVDNFKDINDQFGHDIGDKVLRNVASVLLKSTRSSDILARVGGEEFAILAQFESVNLARTYAERIRQAIANEVFTAQNLCITISVGLAICHQQSLAELFKAADKLLYTAKSKGKNCVVAEEFR